VALRLGQRVFGHSKFSDQGSVIRLVFETQGGNAMFTVSDSGSGISTQDQASMFTPFFRGTNPLTTSTAGSGLGLSVVQSLVTLHDGRIAIDSKMGIGTSITVTFPGVSSASSDG